MQAGSELSEGLGRSSIVDLNDSELIELATGAFLGRKPNFARSDHDAPVVHEQIFIALVAHSLGYFVGKYFIEVLNEL